MSISGTTTTCEIPTNAPFVVQGGLNEINLSTINITDENGLDVSECFGISTDIITVEGTNVTLTGECDTSLEILITQGIDIPISCEYVAYKIGQDGVLIFTFADGSTSTNIHPDCCTSLGYDPEIGPEHWWICRSIPVIDPLDCDNYTPNGDTSPEDWIVFDFVTGGTVTTVPSADCCYQYGFVDILVNGDVKCITEVISPCEGYTVLEPVPLTGPIPFTDPNGQQTIIVPASECCTNLGYSYFINGGGFTCYQNSGDLPTVSITNDGCCEEVAPPSECYEWDYNIRTSNIPSGEGTVIGYIDCNDESQVLEFFWNTGTHTGTICVKSMVYIEYYGGICYNPLGNNGCDPIILGESHGDGGGSYVTSENLFPCPI